MFLVKMRYQFGDDTFALPEPEYCPQCRLQIRTAHRNEMHLHHCRSSVSDKQLISIYRPEAPWGAPYKIYSHDEWWSDDWEPRDFGRPFDFSRPFFEQFAELSKEVPRMALQTFNNENSPYTTGTGFCKNCYLINSSEHCEDCYYGKLLQNCRDCVDCSYLYDSELCYECFNCSNCYSCTHLYYGQNCSDCWFSENLIGCKNCLFCTNLTQQEYCIRNEKVSKEEFDAAIRSLQGSYSAFSAALEELKELRGKRVHKYAQIIQSQNCTGDFVLSSKDCLDCFDVNGSEDCRYVTVGVEARDCYDCSNVYVRPQLTYNTLGTIENYHCAYSLYVFHSQEILYSEQIFNSKYLFGCSGLRSAEYCVFNQPYSESEYNGLVSKIIRHMQETGEWGNFFPPERSAFPYNDTLASDYFPLPEEVVRSLGWNWMEESEGSVTSGVVSIPDKITDVTDEICKSPLKCAESGRPFKITPQEFKYYRKQGVPIPRISPNARHTRRMQLRNPRQLWERVCDSCSAELVSPYHQSSPFTIHCESCYLSA